MKAYNSFIEFTGYGTVVFAEGLMVDDGGTTIEEEKE